MTKVNVKFNGKVVNLIGKKYAEVATVAIDRSGKSYETVHNLKLGKGFAPAIGTYLAIAGTLESLEGLNWIEATSCVELKGAPEDLNMYAWVEGEAASSFFEPKSLTDEFSSKRPFGVASVKLNETQRQRGIVFNALISKMRENLKAGAIVRLAGRLQYRTYTNAEGKDMTVAEIICNNEWTKILKPSTRKNPFSFEVEPDMSGFGIKE